MRTQILIFIAVLFFAGCAIVVPPVGGPKDVNPPKMDTLKSSRNFQTNFKKQPLELVFNEWVILEDVGKQVVVSPPLRYNAELVKLRGHSVIVDFDPRENLRENVTYTINFGNAVKDLTERNPAKNLRFVFSTGPILDSLFVQGNVEDAITKKPLENVVVMFYDNLKDSVVRKERPLYFARTDKEGKYTINNMRAGKYKVFALEDGNLNYLFDSPKEKIGFPDSLISIQAGAQDTSFSLRVFIETPTMRPGTTIQPHFGLIKIPFTQTPRNFKVAANIPDVLIRTEEDHDSLKIWYAGAVPTTGNWPLAIKVDTLFNDTLSIRAQPKAPYLAKEKLSYLGQGSGKGLVYQNPDRVMKITFNHPITDLYANSVYLFEDSTTLVRNTTFRIDTNNTRQIELKFPWKEDKRYRLLFMPNSLKDLFGFALTDSLKINILAQPRKNFGNIEFKLNHLDSLEQYVVELLNSGDQVLYSFSVSGKTTYTHTLKTLETATFKMRFYEDSNRNGRWDSGVYSIKRQPEPIQIRDLEQVRANWDQELTLEWQGKKK
jgi:hypothetical protein